MLLLQAGPRISRRARLLFICGLSIVVLFAVATWAQAATHSYCSGCIVGPHQDHPDGSSFYLTGSFAQDVTSYSHTVGAGAAFLGSVAYGTPTAFHSYSGSTYTFAFCENATGSVTLAMNCHADY